MVTHNTSAHNEHLHNMLTHNTHTHDSRNNKNNKNKNKIVVVIIKQRICSTTNHKTLPQSITQHGIARSQHNTTHHGKTQHSNSNSNSNKTKKNEANEYQQQQIDTPANQCSKLTRAQETNEKTGTKKHRKHHNTRTTTPETQQCHESNFLEILK